MPPTTDTELKELKDLVIGLREEMRVGFANMDVRFAKLEGDIKAIDQKATALDDKLKGLDGRVWTLFTLILGGLGVISTTLIVRFVLPAIPLK